MAPAYYHPYPLTQSHKASTTTLFPGVLLLGSILLVLLSWLGYPTPVLGQGITQGTIIRADTREPVPYASVGVKGKPLGTVANEVGLFRLQPLEQALPTDTVIISCVGFMAQKRLAAELRQHPAILLTPQATQLTEVAVRHGKLRPQVLGREGTGGMAHWGNWAPKDSLPKDKRGWEVGTFLTPSDNCFVDAFSLYVELNNFRFVRFRVMLYAVEENRPTTPLTNQDMQFVLGDQHTGWVKVDLRPYNLHLKKDQKIALALQWLDNDEPMTKGKHLSVPAAFPDPFHRAYVRDKSQAQWQLYPVSPSMNLSVQSYQD
ncbi:carboxypeptidase-like regulatory domain-containing protein [Hymenobacter mucosus]|uniref:carboxypeptidase-like regulatory domain-containing protein n=1 Tax=Hymenobacter mucosus TaxID=1411120 RepID=UPI000B774D31|nr:carboxypeptidase-like regulatory domain-containing protein [Hymenobacter mucosus]